MTAFDLLIGLAAIVIIVAISAALQRGGVAQPFAMAVAMAAGLLTFFPVMRRWSRTAVPLYKWIITIAAIVVISLLIHLALLRI